MSTQRQQRQQELESLLDTFTMDGWKLFASECHGLLNSMRVTAAAECDTTEKWFTRRGQITQLEQILMYAPVAMKELKDIDKTTFDDEEAPHVPNELEE